MMNDRQNKIGQDLMEVGMEDPVRNGVGQTQGPHVDTQVSIRVATRWDGERLRRMFSRLSSETIYLRFHIPYKDVPEPMLVLMLEVDHPDKEFLVAFSEEEEIVGHAMYARLGDGAEAEMAIIVEDGWQSKGVGKLLLRRLAEEAKRRSIETFSGLVLVENRRMLGLIESVFSGATYTIEDDAYHVVVALDSPEGVAAA
jgi:acetyltransferase